MTKAQPHARAQHGRALRYGRAACQLHPPNEHNACPCMHSYTCAHGARARAGVRHSCWPGAGPQTCSGAAARLPEVAARDVARRDKGVAPRVQRIRPDRSTARHLGATQSHAATDQAHWVRVGAMYNRRGHRTRHAPGGRCWSHTLCTRGAARGKQAAHVAAMMEQGAVRRALTTSTKPLLAPDRRPASRSAPTPLASTVTCSNSTPAQPWDRRQVRVGWARRVCVNPTTATATAPRAPWHGGAPKPAQGIGQRVPRAVSCATGGGAGQR